MKLGEIGERAFLSSIRDFVSEIEGGVLGFDEDASDVPLKDGSSLVVNVDTFVGSTDWLPGMTEAQVGRKTAVMALSDIVAKGARPMATLLSLCVPTEFEAKRAQELIRGFSQYCLKSSVSFIGGDVGTTSDTVLTAIALGFADSQRLVTRSGAMDGDTIAVTSPFGLTSVAYKTLIAGMEVDDDLRIEAIQAAYKPRIDFGLVAALSKESAVSSAMDSSDGLGITLNTMASQSRLRFIIDRLPAAEGVELFARQNSLSLLDLVTQGGEEFTLVLTIPDKKWDEALQITEKENASLISIGTVEKGEGVVFESSEGYVEIPAKGYDNFREWR
ncbi:MAG: thiamine-phosphate kinase [Candidatus Thorarchaeota archaeon]|jgi:thiamine-monophosphate kinase